MNKSYRIITRIYFFKQFLFLVLEGETSRVSLNFYKMTWQYISRGLVTIFHMIHVISHIISSIKLGLETVKM